MRKTDKGIPAVLLLVGIFSTSITTIQHSAEAYMDPNTLRSEKAPSVVTGDNVYIVWWTDKGTPNTNGEVMFRASSDGGATFSNKTNLSNTTDADSVDAEIAAEGENVIVTWWERNQTSDVPVARISTDGGETFGPMIMLGMNGTIDSAAEEVIATEAGEEEGEEGATPEGVIEEAVGGPEVAE